MMRKEITYYDDKNKQVHNEVIHYRGRFNDDTGDYALYSNGQTINRRINAELPVGMSKIDIANMVLLSVHLLPNTNVLGYRANDGLRPMGLDRIGKVIGTQDRQTRRFINKMVNLHLIVQADHGQAVIGQANMGQAVVGQAVVGQVVGVSDSLSMYIINPLYFLNGKKITPSLYYSFKEELDKHLPNWVQKKFLNFEQEENQ